MEMTEGGKMTGWSLAHVIFNVCNPVLGTLRPPSDSRTRGIEGLQASSILAGGQIVGVKPYLLPQREYVYSGAKYE